MRDVVGFEGYYKVTSCGKIWSVRRKKFINSAGGVGNYQMVCLYVNGKQYFDYVHRIVAKAYIPNPDNLPQVNHKDEVKDHNWANNLEWCTPKYNLAYSNIWSTSGRVKKPVYCVELDTTYKSIHEASKATGVAQSNLSTLLRDDKTGKRTLGGFHWRYAG